MSRNLGQDGLDAVMLTVAFMREEMARQGRPVTQKQVDARRQQVKEFKDARPGLDSGLAGVLDGTVKALVDALALQNRRQHRR
jgi:hypothetical protein